ncbi:MAG: hypothetical protein GEU93_07430 [Propionibacteriales bacterium]|nr:hypothetical protein [Propionibacteriales bacterium]
MALVAFASSKGSPGATTAALAIGALWPRPVVVAECDTAGSDIAIRMPALDGGVLDADRGLVTLAAAGRRGLRSDLLLSHTQQVIGGLDVLVGLRVPEQAAGIGNMWPQLGSIFDGLQGYDVLADLGRCGAQTPQNALMRSARLLVMVCDTEPSSVVHLRERINVLARDLDPANPHGVPIAVMVVADPKKKREAVREVFAALDQMDVPISYKWVLAWDPQGAQIFAGAVTGRPDRTALVRSARQVAGDLSRAVAPFFVPADQPYDAWPQQEAEGEWHMQVEPQPWQQPHLAESEGRPAGQPADSVPPPPPPPPPPEHDEAGPPTEPRHYYHAASPEDDQQGVRHD